MTSITPYLLLKDCEAALDWPCRAFGFEETLRYVGPEVYVNHAEMGHPGGSSRTCSPGCVRDDCGAETAHSG